MANFDQKKLIAAGFVYDTEQGTWSRGFDASSEYNEPSLGVEAPTSDNFSQVASAAPAFDFNSVSDSSIASWRSQVDSAVSSIGASFPIPQTASELKSFHMSEMSTVIAEGLALQQQRTVTYVADVNSRLDAQSAYIQTNKTDPKAFSSSYLNLQMMRRKELADYISVQEAVLWSLGGEVNYGMGMIWWPETDAEAAAGQAIVDEYQPQYDALKSQIAELNAALAEIDNDISQTQSDMVSITNGNTPDRFDYSKYDQQAEEALKAVIDLYGDIYEHLGETAAMKAMMFENAVVGQKIKTYAEAMSAWNKYGPAVLNKFSAADKQAIANALGALDQQNLADTYAKFAKYLKVTSIALDVNKVRLEVQTALNTNDWNPVFNTVSSVLAGALATEWIAFILGIYAVTPLSVAALAIMGIAASDYLSEQRMAEFAAWVESL